MGLGSLPEPLVGDAAHWKHVGAARQLAQVRQAVRSTREALRVFKSTFGLTGRRLALTLDPHPEPGPHPRPSP